MSGIAGIYNLDGAAPDGAILTRMLDSIRHRGPDGGAQWSQGAVSLGHRMLHTTPESLSETQPLVDQSGNLCLTFDGRIDNRTELIDAVNKAGRRLRSATDAELVLCAYEAWGEDCPKHILGDFAFVIWDGRTREMFCARDPLGIRPLYYYRGGAIFAFGSELHQLLQHPAVHRQPNEGFIAEQLSGAGQNLEETLYQNIFQLPRAHSLTIGPGRFWKKRYWDLMGIRPLHYAREEDYSDHFLTIFREAVRCRLRTHRPISAELSGGLDSSSVVSMASSLNPYALEAVSMVFPGQPCDETPFIQEVLGRYRVPWNPVSEVIAKASEYVDRTRRYQDYAELPGLLMFNAQMSVAQQKGARVVLTGQGGDDFLTGGVQYIMKLVREFRLVDAYRRGRSDSQVIASQTYRRPSAAFLVLQNGIWPWLPEPAKKVLRAMLGRKPKELFPWISPAFAKKTDLIRRLQEQEGASRESRLLRYREDAQGGLDWPWYWMLDRYSAGFGLEYRHPFLDRRVIEFSVALPQDQLRRGIETKYILRRSMRGLLPDMIRTRISKAFYTHPIEQAIRAFGREGLYGSLSLAENGWLDSKRVGEILQTLVSQPTSDAAHATGNLVPLWMICATELWFRSCIANDPRLFRGSLVN